MDAGRDDSDQRYPNEPGIAAERHNRFPPTWRAPPRRDGQCIGQSVAPGVDEASRPGQSTKNRGDGPGLAFVQSNTIQAADAC